MMASQLLSSGTCAATSSTNFSLSSSSSFTPLSYCRVSFGSQSSFPLRLHWPLFAATQKRISGAFFNGIMAASSLELRMKTYKLSELNDAEVRGLRERPRIDFSSIFKIVSPIVEDVRSRGDSAVIDYTTKFDGVKMDSVLELVADLPDPKLDADVKSAFDVAYNNIYAFHAAQKRTHELHVENMPGVKCRRLARAINAVGLYVPGGTAVLPSTALMLAVPAQIAGCKTVIIATPPRKDGSICPEVLYCAKKAGVTFILKAGGAQAVAGLAWGTETCPKVSACCCY